MASIEPTTPQNGSSCSNARLAFHTDGCSKPGSSTSTSMRAEPIAGGSYGSKTTPEQVGKPLVPQPNTWMVVPGLVNELISHTLAAAPWNLPMPPRSCAGRSRSEEHTSELQSL